MLRDPPTIARGRNTGPWSAEAEQLAEEVLRLELMLDAGMCRHHDREVLRARLAAMTGRLEILRRREWGTETLLAGDDDGNDADVG